MLRHPFVHLASAGVASLLMLVSGAVAATEMAAGGAAIRPPLLAAADLGADVDVLEDALKTLHPGIHRYSTPDQFDARLRDLRRELAAGASLDQAFLAITRFAAAIRCGHTWTNPLNQPPRVAGPLLGQPDRLPLHFRVVGRRFLVTDALARSGVRRGDEIVAIDGVPAGDVIARLWPYLRADGSSDGKRLAQIGHDAGQSAFDIYYSLIDPPVAGRRTLTLRNGGTSRARSVAVSLLTETARERSLGTHPPGADAWRYRQDGDLAIVTMPTWAFWNRRFDWRAWLEKTFADIAVRGTRFLVLDLRANEGGDDAIGQWLLEHIAATPRDYANHRALLVYDVVPDRVRPYLSTWDKAFYDQRPRETALGDGTFALRDEAAERGRVQPAAGAFHGATFVLTGPNNSSATFEFARVIKEIGLATLVGQATGGNRRGITGGNLFFLTLPHTGITIDVPVIAWTPRDAQPDAPVIPDVLVEPDLVAQARGEDPELRRTYALIAAAREGVAREARH